MSIQKSRYEFHLKAFGSAVSESIKQYQSDAKNLPGQILYKKDGRTPLFQLQGLARIDSKISRHKELAEDWLVQFKQIEDAISKYDYWFSMIQNNLKWKFPLEINTYFNNQAFYCLGVLEHLLIKFGWMTKVINEYTYSEKPLVNFEKSTKKAEWFKSDKEKNKLLEFYRDEITKINHKIESNEIDLNKVEEGIHEFRRKLRWIGIYSSALRGKVAIAKPSVGDELSKYVTKENIGIKYNKMPVNPVEKDIIKFLPGGFYAMSELIKKIGDIKDLGLCSEEMTVVGKMFGLRPEKIRKHLGADFLPHSTDVKSAKALVVNYVQKDKILLHIANYFDKQIK